MLHNNQLLRLLAHTGVINFQFHYNQNNIDKIHPAHFDIYLILLDFFYNIR